MAEAGQERVKTSKRPTVQNRVDSLTKTLSEVAPNPNKTTIDKLARSGVAGQLKIERLRRDVQRVEELLMVDSLTGLLTERAMQQEIDEKIAIAKREETEAVKQGEEVKKRTYAVIFMDLNNLKQVNDLSEDQHTAGDILLKAFAHILKKTARPGDILARRNKAGDEFVLILENSDLEGGLKFWARENKNFRSYINGEYGMGSIWVSAGLAEATADTIIEKIEVADRALRLAKNEAKSRTDTVNTIKTEIDLELQGK